MNNNQRDNQGRLWLRCPECGDSTKNKYKAHMCVYEDGGTFCHKCGHSTKLSIGDLIALSFGDATVEEIIERQLEAREQQVVNTPRYSALTKYTVYEQPDWDAFQMRLPGGDLVGWHIRKLPSKQFVNEGSRGLGYVGDKLVSTPKRPLTIVESPYDCLEDNFVSVFGLISASTLKWLRLQWCWLWPDPDVTCTPLLRRKFYEKVVLPATENMVQILGVVLSPSDPDESPPEMCKHYFLDDFRELVYGHLY